MCKGRLKVLCVCLFELMWPDFVCLFVYAFPSLSVHRWLFNPLCASGGGLSAVLGDFGTIIPLSFILNTLQHVQLTNTDTAHTPPHYLPDMLSLCTRSTCEQVQLVDTLYCTALLGLIHKLMSSSFLILQLPFSALHVSYSSRIHTRFPLDVFLNLHSMCN